LANDVPFRDAAARFSPVSAGSRRRRSGSQPAADSLMSLLVLSLLLVGRDASFRVPEPRRWHPAAWDPPL